MTPRKARLGGTVWWTVVLGSLLLIGTVVTLLAFKDAQPRLAITVDNLGETIAAAWGALGCAWGARHSSGRQRRALGWLAAASGAWAAGQAVWTYYEVLVGRETPFPSVADVGYLGFLVAAAIGVGLLPGPARPGDRRRLMLDAAMVATAISLISSTSTLRAVIEAGGDSPLALGISVAYPIGDVVLITATLLALVESTGRRVQLGLIVASMAAMTLADSAFAYLQATGDYGTGTLVDVGWCIAFCGIGLAGITATSGADTQPSPERSLASDLLPYGTAAAGALVALYAYFTGTGLTRIGVLLISLLISLVLVRQYLALVDNQALNAALAEREDRLRHLAFHDDLTGLANRPLFIERVTTSLAEAPATGNSPSVAFVDLDGFKWVNDTLGHAQGDELLISVARRLQSAIQPADTLARLGGDEFAVMFTGPHDPDIAASQLVQALRTPFHVAGRRMRVSASVGVARLDPGQADAHAGTLLQRADIAMFMVKRAGKNSHQRYTSGMGLEAVDDLTLQDALAKAIDNGEISVAYQPVMDLSTGRMHSLEALARWQYEGLDVSPEVFVPISERIGRSGRLTAHVLGLACRQMVTWSDTLGHRDLKIAVNISPAELGDPTLPARVGATLHRLGMSGSQLVLEVTESGLLGDPEAIQDVLATLRELNVSLALDDFGTGYNTLAQLLKVRLDTVKIDQVFVQDIDRDPRHRAFLEAMLMLLGRLGVNTVAEGVERPEQVEVLREMGCKMAQGFLLGRPYSGEDITPLVLDLAAGPAPALPAPRTPADAATTAAGVAATDLV